MTPQYEFLKGPAGYEDGTYRCPEHGWSGSRPECPQCFVAEQAAPTSPPPTIQTVRCVRCGGIVDPKGVIPERYCLDVCKWPQIEVLGVERWGCGERIFFLVNHNGNIQPFDLSNGKPHHATCSAWRYREHPERTCPRCFAMRTKNGPCNKCGWLPLVPNILETWSR